MTDRDTSVVFLTLTQVMTSQDNVVTSKVQATTTQMNRDVVHQVPQHAYTMAHRLRDYTRNNPLMFFGTKLDVDPQYFLDEVYNMLYAMGVTSIEKVDLAAYQLKDMSRIRYV